MPGQLVASGLSFAAGLRTEALSTYRRKYTGIESKLGPAMRFNVPSTRRTEDYYS